MVIRAGEDSAPPRRPRLTTDESWRFIEAASPSERRSGKNELVVPPPSCFGCCTVVRVLAAKRSQVFSQSRKNRTNICDKRLAGKGFFFATGTQFGMRSAPGSRQEDSNFPQKKASPTCPFENREIRVEFVSAEFAAAFISPDEREVDPFWSSRAVFVSAAA